MLCYDLVWIKLIVCSKWEKKPWKKDVESAFVLGFIDTTIKNARENSLMNVCNFSLSAKN